MFRSPNSTVLLRYESMKSENSLAISWGKQIPPVSPLKLFLDDQLAQVKLKLINKIYTNKSSRRYPAIAILEILTF